MRASGNSTKLVEKENSGMLMVIFSRVNGETIRQMATEFISIRMELGMKVSGKMIFNMVLERKSGLTALSTRVTTLEERSTEKVFTCGKMVPCTTVNGSRTESKDMESTVGGTVEDTLEIGKIIICMGQVSTLGLMVGSMRVSMRWTRNMEWVFTHGLMGDSMMAPGSMENSMEREGIFSKMAKSKSVGG